MMGDKVPKLVSVIAMILILSLLVVPLVEGQNMEQPTPRAPDIEVKKIEFSHDEPMEDDNITITATVQNNWYVPIQDVTMLILVDNMEIDNVSGIELEKGETGTYEVSWKAGAGIHNVSAVLRYQGEIIPESTASEELTVDPKPIGDVSSLLISLGVIAAAILLINLFYSAVKAMKI